MERLKTVLVRFTPEEFEELERMAKENGFFRMGSFLRFTVMQFTKINQGGKV